MRVLATSVIVFTLLLTSEGFQPTADLPDVLTAIDGTRVASKAQWQARREELKLLLDTHILGTRPSERPALVNATTMSKRGDAPGEIVKEWVRLEFRVREELIPVEIELLYAHNTSRLPVVVTQFDHRAWALRAVSRGMVGVLVPTGDTHDATWPFYLAYNRSGAVDVAEPVPTWGLITRRSWLASLVIDYMILHRQDLVDSSRVSVFGHSRNGKQSLITAAYDDRVASAVGSSPGFPIATPARFASNEYAGEQWPSSLTGAGAPCPSPPPGIFWPQWEGCHWWVRSTQQYYGRAAELPADGHMVLALIAPRPVLIGSAHNDHDSDNSFANERALKSLRALHDLLGANDTVRISYRPGDHVGLIDVDLYLDWFSEATGGRVPSRETFPLQLMHSFDWNAWAANPVQGGSTPPMPLPSTPLEDRMAWLLGERLPRFGGHTVEAQAGEEYLEVLLLHDQLNKSDPGVLGAVSRVPIGVGDGLTAELYFPTAAFSTGATPLKLVIVLPGYFYNTGFSPGHYSIDWKGPDGQAASLGDVYHELAGRGFAALGFDPDGMGVRIARDGPPNRFYRRYPRASRFGRMLQDLQSVLDWVECVGSRNLSAAHSSDKRLGAWAVPERAHRCSPWDWPGSGEPGYQGPAIEPRVWLVGYSIGGLLALHAAALDNITAPQIEGVASFSGFTPMRSDDNNRPTGGRQRLYDWHALLPRLGLGVPYDVDELLSAVVPRPTLLVTPMRDQGANYSEVAATIAQVRGRWPTGALTEIAPSDGPASTSEFGRVQIDALVKWLESASGHNHQRAKNP